MGEHKVAVFLDRDGVINHPIVREGKPYPPTSSEEFRIMDGVADGCRELKAAGYLLIVATNQPDVGRGTLVQAVVEEIHSKMLKMLPIDCVKVCYDAGGEPASPFRKPAPGMLLESAAEFHLDLGLCWMIGDRWRDIDCGSSAGCSTIFLDYGYDEDLRTPPDFRVKTFSQAVSLILNTNKTP